MSCLNTVCRFPRPTCIDCRLVAHASCCCCSTCYLLSVASVQNEKDAEFGVLTSPPTTWTTIHHYLITLHPLHTTSKTSCAAATVGPVRPEDDAQYIYKLPKFPRVLQSVYPSLERLMALVCPQTYFVDVLPENCINPCTISFQTG